MGEASRSEGNVMQRAERWCPDGLEDGERVPYKHTSTSRLLEVQRTMFSAPKTPRRTQSLGDNLIEVNFGPRK